MITNYRRLFFVLITETQILDSRASPFCDGWWYTKSHRNEHLSLLVQIKFLNLFLYISKWKLKNLLVRTKFCWSWEWGPVHREVCYDPFLPDQIFQKYALYIYIILLNMLDLFICQSSLSSVCIKWFRVITCVLLVLLKC